MSIYGAGTKLRLSGMASGMDTDALVQNMLKLEQLKVDREYRAKTNAQWKADALKGVSSDLKGFTDTYMSALSPDNMLTSKAYYHYNVTHSNNADNAITVKAGPGAVAGSFTINQVKQLAEAANAKGISGISNGKQLSADNNEKLGELDFANKLFASGEDTIAFSINGKDFEFGKEDTLQNMLDTVNKSGAGVTMRYSRLTDSFSIESNTMGAVDDKGNDNRIVVQNIKGNAFSTEGTRGAFGIREGSYANGKDAIFFVDGKIVSKNTNTIYADGITYELNSVTEEDANIKIKIEQDVEPAIDAIKKFVEGYNTLIKKLDELVTERKTKAQKKYTPLTEEEKSAMTEEQIKTWEEVAKIGTLGNDSDIKKLISDIRLSFYDKVESSGLSPADIGIRIDDLNWKGGGTIRIDEDRLREALLEDTEAVMNTMAFVVNQDSDDPAQDYKERGLVSRIQKHIKDYNQKVEVMEGSTQENLTKKINSYDKQIEKLERRMDEMAERYYLKFAAMEKMLSQLQSQGDWMTSMLGGGGQ